MAQKRRVPVRGPGGHEARSTVEPVTLTAEPDEEHTDVAPPLPACDCPRLEPEDWHEVESDWSDITFIRGGLWAILGVPLAYNRIEAKLTGRAEAAGATVPDSAMLLLGEGRLRRTVLLEVERAPESASLVRPGGVAYTRMVNAPPGQVKKVVKDTVAKAQKRYGRKPDRTYLWFLTCHVCSQARNFETLVVAHYRNKK